MLEMQPCSFLQEHAENTRFDPYKMRTEPSWPKLWDSFPLLSSKRQMCQPLA